jgi:HEAT repeat protein
MPLKNSSSLRRHARPYFVTSLLAVLMLAFLFIIPEGPAHAQRKGKSGAAQAGNDNASSAKTDKPKRVFVGGSSSTPKGSRVTIKSDNPLNDYSAYRSGDRFYVVVPGASAGSVAKGASGRGYSDMQVQQRGKDVVLSYRVQPGAKPKVEQKFNRLDVVFEAAEGTTAPSDNARTTTTTNRSSTPSSQSSGANLSPTGQTSAPAANQGPADRNTTRPAANVQGASESNASNPPAASSAPQQSGVVEPGSQASMPPVAEQSPGATPSGTPAAEQQIAQALPPTTTAPITATTSNTQNVTQPGTSIGAVVMRNWPLALTLALLLVGVGLFIAARRSSATEQAPREEPSDKDGPVALKAGRPSKLMDAPATSTPRAVETKSAAAAETSSAIAAAMLVASERKSPKEKKKKKKEARERAKEEKPVAVEDAGAFASTAAVTTDAVTTTDAVASTDTVAEETVSEETTVSSPAVILASAAASSTVSEEAEAERVAQEPAPVVRELEPAVSLEGDVVQTETKHLLDGEPFDARVVGTSDVMARQMIAAELLAALAGRNVERRARAGAAFVEHGYFDETVKDLRAASAPAERASAARSLGLAGERTATAHLVDALEDSSVEVRRAAVEALASLRDPDAVEPLEALLEREKKSKTKVNRKLVLHAVENCREGLAEPPAALAAALPVESAVSVESAAPLADMPSAEITPAVEEIATPPVAETAPELLVTEDASVETVAPDAAAAEADEETTAEVSPVGLETVTQVEPLAETFEAVAPPAHVFETAEATEPRTEDFELREDEPEAATLDLEPVSAAAEDASEEVVVAFDSGALAEWRFEEPDAPQTADEIAPALEAESFAPAADVRAADVKEVELFSETETEPSLPFAGSVEEAEDLQALYELDAPSTPEAEVSPFEPEPSEPQRAEEPVSARENEDFEDYSSVSLAEEAEETETARAQDAGDWVEFDMNEAATASSTHAIEPLVPAFEDYEGDTFPNVSAQPQAETQLEALHMGEASISSTEPQTEDFTSVHFAEAPAVSEKSVEPFDELSTVPALIQHRLASGEAEERASAIMELSRLDTGEAFQQICAAFDDDAREVRNAAARALYDLRADRAESFTRALRESDAERRRQIGSAISASGLATEAISQLTGESREKTYEAFSLLFLMAKAGEVQPLIRAIEGHPNNEVRLAVVKLLALSSQKDVLPAFRRLAVRGSLPTEVRSAVMEAIYQISSSQPDPTHA